MTQSLQDIVASPAPGRSLEDVHGSVRVPQAGHWWRRLFAFAGPAYMVAVGYMDPGNWATDIEGGSKFAYRLIWVLLMSNLMAILLQTLSARLGLATGRDLAQACRDSYGPGVRWALFILCEIAIAACDLAEVLGTAIGIHLLFPRIPLMAAVLVTVGDVFVLLAIQKWGMRKMEALILVLIGTIGACFLIEVFLTKPQWASVAGGFRPRLMRGEELYAAIAIIGATVMPHNLYLHSSLVQSRAVEKTHDGIAQACRYNFFDSVIALNIAFFVNVAILVVAAAAFASRHIQVEGVADAHRLLSNLLGGRVAPIAFAVALIFAGLSSTVTGTLAGQITMEGFIHFRLRPWLRRLITRSLAVAPAILVIGASGEKGVESLLVFSQVVLSLQLPFAVVPLVRFTNSKRHMGPFANPVWVAILAWIVTITIIALNVQLTVQQIGDWRDAAGIHGHAVVVVSIAISMLLGCFLLWLTFRPERETRSGNVTRAGEVFDLASVQTRAVRRIGVALEAVRADAPMLADAIDRAKAYGAELVLIHIVEGVGGQWYGEHTSDAESRHDDAYLTELADKIRTAVPNVRTALGYGPVARQIIKIAKREKLDLLIIGGHGHRGIMDVFRGQTINSVRHGLGIPVLAVRK